MFCIYSLEDKIGQVTWTWGIFGRHLVYLKRSYLIVKLAMDEVERSYHFLNFVVSYEVERFGFLFQQ